MELTRKFAAHIFKFWICEFASIRRAKCALFTLAIVAINFRLIIAAVTNWMKERMQVFIWINCQLIAHCSTVSVIWSLSYRCLSPQFSCSIILQTNSFPSRFPVAASSEFYYMYQSTALLIAPETHRYTSGQLAIWFQQSIAICFNNKLSPIYFQLTTPTCCRNRKLPHHVQKRSDQPTSILIYIHTTRNMMSAIRSCIYLLDIVKLKS